MDTSYYSRMAADMVCPLAAIAGIFRLAAIGCRARYFHYSRFLPVWIITPCLSTSKEKWGKRPRVPNTAKMR